MASVLSLPGLAGNYPSTPDAGPIQITGNIDVRVEAAFDGWESADEQYLIAKRQVGCYWFRVHLSGKLQAGAKVGVEEIWAALATTPIHNIVADGQNIQLRFTRVAATGLFSYFYKTTGALADSVGWIADGTSTKAAGNIVNNADILEVGSAFGGSADLAQGKFYRAQVYDGIAGTLAFDADFTAEAPGTTNFTESSVNAATVTINQSGSPQAEIVVDPLFVRKVVNYHAMMSA